MRPRKNEKDKLKNRFYLYFTDAITEKIRLAAAAVNCKSPNQWIRELVLQTLEKIFEKEDASQKGKIVYEVYESPKVELSKELEIRLLGLLTHLENKRNDVSYIPGRLEYLADRFDKKEDVDVQELLSYMSDCSEQIAEIHYIYDDIKRIMASFFTSKRYVYDSQHSKKWF